MTMQLNNSQTQRSYHFAFSNANALFLGNCRISDVRDELIFYLKIAMTDLFLYMKAVVPPPSFLPDSLKSQPLLPTQKLKAMYNSKSIEFF